MLELMKAEWVEETRWLQHVHGAKLTLSRAKLFLNAECIRHLSCLCADMVWQKQFNGVGCRLVRFCFVLVFGLLDPN